MDGLSVLDPEEIEKLYLAAIPGLWNAEAVVRSVTISIVNCGAGIVSNLAVVGWGRVRFFPIQRVPG
jgi:hypothetical protein